MGFVSKWKGALDNAIKKKWPKDHIDLEEDASESSTFVYCKEVVTIVSKMSARKSMDDESSQRREGSWNDEKKEILEMMMRFSKGVDDQLLIMH